MAACLFLKSCATVLQALSTQQCMRLHRINKLLSQTISVLFSCSLVIKHRGQMLTTARKDETQIYLSWHDKSIPWGSWITFQKNKIKKHFTIYYLTAHGGKIMENGSNLFWTVHFEAQLITKKVEFQERQKWEKIFISLRVKNNLISPLLKSSSGQCSTFMPMMIWIQKIAVVHQGLANKIMPFADISP